MSFDPRRAHLTHWGEVREHLDDSRRWARYRRLLEDFGVDPEIAVEAEHATPRFLFAEHPGNWAYPADVVRVRLATAMAHRVGTEPEVLQFENDVFRKNGIKRFFTQWCLHPLLPWASLARAKPSSSQEADNGPRRNGTPLGGSRGSEDASVPQHRTTGTTPGRRADADTPLPPRRNGHRSNSWHRLVYSSIRLRGLNRQTLTDKLNTALELIRYVDAGRLPLPLLNSALSPAARELLGGPWNRQAAYDLARSMHECDLTAAQEPLLEGLQALEDPGELTWADLWRRINSVLLGLPVGRVDPILEGFLLKIRDPYKMAHRLAALSQSRRVPVAAFVDHGEFRLVLYDTSSRRFLAMRSTGDREGRPISWDIVRHHAEAGLGGTPSATIEYLMLAASGFFIVCDPFDGQTPFERRVAQLHRRAIRRRFPWVSLTRRFVSGHFGSYLDCYHANLGTFIQQKIDGEFFREGLP